MIDGPRWIGKREAFPVVFREPSVRRTLVREDIRVIGVANTLRGVNVYQDYLHRFPVRWLRQSGCGSEPK
jgi:hypothetical protein